MIYKVYLWNDFYHLCRIMGNDVFIIGGNIDYPKGYWTSLDIVKRNWTIEPSKTHNSKLGKILYK